VRQSVRENWIFRIQHWQVLVLVCLCLFSGKAKAFSLTSYFEVQLIPNVSTSWTTVNLDNTYADAIPVCTYVLDSFSGTAGNYSNPPAVTRIRNITASSFELRIQGWEDSAAVPNDVHCLVMDSGAHTLPDGRLVEAHSVFSDLTTGQNPIGGGWNAASWEDVSSTIVHNYTNPVVLGQVMSHNDNRASVIFVNDCDARGNHPFQSGMADGICVSKHIGQISSDRNAETIGYIVAEAGSGTVNNVFYELARGPDSVSGNNNSNSGYTYALNSDHNIAVLTQGGEDGGNGSWAVLYGNDPLSPNTMRLAVDEEVFEGDTSRNHTTERVFYWAFTAAEITLVKNLVNDDNGTATLDDFPLTATGPSTISGVSGTADVTTAAVLPGTYTLSEANIPGYTAGNWSCTGASSFSGNTVELSIADQVVCTITNDDIDSGRLTLVKQVTNSFGGTGVAADFELEFTGPGGAATGFTGDAAITSVVLIPGLYNLDESSVPGYNQQSIQCDGTDIDGSDGIQLADGEDVTCVFINVDDPNFTTLTLIKNLTNDSGGTAAAADFELTFTGPAGSVSGISGDAAITSAPVIPGVYNLTESTVAGYTLDGITCNGSDVDGSDGVSIVWGENVTCTFINNDEGIDLSIAKSVDNTAPNIGDTLTFSLEIANAGPDQATDIEVIDQIPAGFSYVAASMAGGDVRDDSSPTGTGLRWTINSLNSGATATLTFQATVLTP